MTNKPYKLSELVTSEMLAELAEVNLFIRESVLKLENWYDGKNALHVKGFLGEVEAETIAGDYTQTRDFFILLEPESEVFLNSSKDKDAEVYIRKGGHQRGRGLEGGYSLFIDMPIARFFTEASTRIKEQFGNDEVAAASIMKLEEFIPKLQTAVTKKISEVAEEPQTKMQDALAERANQDRVALTGR